MHIGGTKHFDAAPERVFDALVDPQLLGDFLPGMESLDVLDETHWSAVMRLPLSPVSLTLDFELRERRRPDRALLSARGKRFGAGAAVETSFELAPHEAGTAMTWAADVDLSGTLSRLGGVLRPVAQQQAERFLEKLDRTLAGSA